MVSSGADDDVKDRPNNSWPKSRVIKSMLGMRGGASRTRFSVLLRLPTARHSHLHPKPRVPRMLQLLNPEPRNRAAYTDIYGGLLNHSPSGLCSHNLAPCFTRSRTPSEREQKRRNVPIASHQQERISVENCSEDPRTGTHSSV
ncbi:hypothetical protein Hypma_009424 [Hypsizygus marmoreus]|uniref:Uncharacterized protein n=1 Tax=Hypsizygus marmoreus TaxID=39966 RepID=A0A369JR04_HYPMA|nr:hypothetical protein Hypma_009424 [Hypsizygus marmoreus]